MQKAILEILVDKKNEKGSDVFYEILLVLHRAFLTQKSKESFSFEITKVGNRIRFFFICPKHFENFLKNQIYAHFSNVDISVVSDPLRPIPNDKMYVGDIKTAKHHFYSIKTFDGE